MTDQAQSADDGVSELTIEEAGALLDARLSEDETNQTAESADPATAEQESTSQEGDDAPEQDRVEDEADDPEAEKLPPIERPRSWSKDDDDDWAALPRERQEKIAANEQAREKDITRRINEAAEKLKVVTAKEQLAEQARQNYETQVKAALSVIEREQAAQFPDIRTTADVTNLAATDPLRYLQWKAHQDELAWASAAAEKSKQQSDTAKQSQRAAYSKEQADKLKELVPDFADPKKLGVARERAVELLGEYGLSQEQLRGWYGSDQGFELLESAGFQKLLADVMNFRDADAARSKAVKAVVSKPVPQVQRPGNRTPNRGNEANLQALSHRLSESGSVDDAWALYEAKLNNQSRRAH